MNQKKCEFIAVLIWYPSVLLLYNLYQNKNKTIIINEPKDTEGER